MLLLSFLQLSTLGYGSDKLSKYCNDNQGRVYPNCKFHDPWGSPGAGILMLERGHIRHYNEFVLSSLYQNIAH